MGAVANAATLARDAMFRDRVLAALVYQARVVVADEQRPRAERALAAAVVRAPLSFAETAAWVLAADPQVAANATASTVGEQLLLDRVMVAWPYLAGVAGPYPGSV